MQVKIIHRFTLEEMIRYGFEHNLGNVEVMTQDMKRQLTFTSRGAFQFNGTWDSENEEDGKFIFEEEVELTEDVEFDLLLELNTLTNTHRIFHNLSLKAWEAMRGTETYTCKMYYSTDGGDTFTKIFENGYIVK